VETVEARLRLHKITPLLSSLPYAVFGDFVRNDRITRVALTDRLRTRARRGRLWNSPRFLAALRNASYGFDPARARSSGGQDGIFLLDRTYVPRNAMMKKIFDRFLDRPGSGVDKIAGALEVRPGDLQAVRVVSHRLRLLGVLCRKGRVDWIVLVDLDHSK